MGFFSFLDAKTGTTIPAFPWAEEAKDLSDVTMVLPDNTTVTGTYDGYGCIGDRNVHDIIAPFYFKREATSEDIFSTTKFIQFNNEHYVIDQFNYERPIDRPGTEIDGKTMNQLKREGATIESHFDRIHDMIRIVRTKNYNGEKYDDLPPSPQCPFQGYFYNEDIDFNKDLRQ